LFHLAKRVDKGELDLVKKGVVRTKDENPSFFDAADQSLVTVGPGRHFFGFGKGFQKVEEGTEQLSLLIGQFFASRLDKLKYLEPLFDPSESQRTVWVSCRVIFIYFGLARQLKVFDSVSVNIGHFSFMQQVVKVNVQRDDCLA
jgi:hypothetical protein